MEHYTYIVYDACGRTYVGYTVDPDRRIRQHNGLIKGGAKFTTRHATKTCDPNHWRFLITVHSPTFTHCTALSYEWSLKHPDNKRPQSFRTPEARIKALPLVFNNPKFAHLGTFTVCIRTEVDAHIKLLQDTLSGLANVQLVFNHKAASLAPRESTLALSSLIASMNNAAMLP